MPPPWSTSLARPKSPNLALKLTSRITLLDFTSLWTTHCSDSSWR
ncbi:unnamed protein product [Spirodela intermedia]|uniref:Uncharacterized protein n=1 Tax=Spirodela intermedia TaxID=51605 RepID=A0A7I8IZG8_SPIIN|nr:unnamed protein product [Spirodela intermedia]CAA6663102.1 unnamed protein product [Spirodela intermedia]